MITLRKFLSLPAPTAKRKLMRLIGDFEQALAGAEQSESKDSFRRFFDDLHAAICKGQAQEGLVNPAELAKMLSASYSIHAVFAANRLRHILMDELGKVAADWDTHAGPGLHNDDPERLKLNLGTPAELPVLKENEKGLYLDDIRSPYNVGAIFRSAWFFGVKYILLSPETPLPGAKRLDRVSMGASYHITWAVLGRQELLNNLANTSAWIAALESGGDNIHNSSLPSSGWMILGNEELGVHPDILLALDERKASNKNEGAPSVVTIDGSGPKASLNVSVACGIALSAWQAASH